MTLGDPKRALESTFPREEAPKRRTDDIKSLLVPWMGIALVAVALTVQTALFSSTEDTQDDASWLSRLLLGDSSSSNTSTLRVHKPLFPLDSNDHVGFACATVGLMIAAGGGIGGGGILVPIYILVMGFSPKHAIPLSNVTVLGGSIANTLLNTRKRHPLADRPLVDWDLILVMEPLTIAGALIGAFLNKMLPERFLLIMLVALLSFTAYKTLRRAIKMYKQETKHLRALQREDGTPTSELTRMVENDDEEYEEEAQDALLENMETNNDDVDLEEVEINDELQQILDEETVTPMINIKILVVMFVVVLIINLLKGGGAFPSPLGIKCGSQTFWLANGLMMAWILLVSLFARSYLVQRFERKQQTGYKYVEGDIEWDGRATIVYPAICCLAGFFAGMFGVGGGIVKGPLMLQMGVHPAVSSATSACMILFTSFTATTSFVVFGLLVEDYAVVCLIIGFLATLAGQVGLSYLMKRYQRNSYIAFSIGGVVLLSALLMTIQSLISMAERQHHHSGGICGKGD